MTETIRVERVSSLHGLDVEWNDLARGRPIFATWEWADAWWRQYGAGAELLVHRCFSPENELVAIVPLYRRRRASLDVVRFLGHGEADELGPVCPAGASQLAGASLRRVLEGLAWDVFAGEQLPADARWSAMLPAERVGSDASPILHAEAGWEAYLAGRSANLRQQVRRRLRAASEAGARFRLADEHTLERDLETLFALHDRRWQGEATGFGDTPLHRELAHAALARDWLRLWLLEVDGTAIAAWHGFQVGQVASYYQAGRDPAFDHLSAGFVVLVHSIREALREGALEYRFGRGGEAFKYRFATDDPGIETVAAARGIRGRAALRVVRTVRAMPSPRRGG